MGSLPELLAGPSSKLQHRSPPTSKGNPVPDTSASTVLPAGTSGWDPPSILYPALAVQPFLDHVLTSLFHSEGSWWHCPLHTNLSRAELCSDKPQMSSPQAQTVWIPVGQAGLVSSLMGCKHRRDQLGCCVGFLGLPRMEFHPLLTHML